MANPTGKGGFQDRKAQINRKGRPRSFDAFRELAQQIAHEELTDASGNPVLIDGHKVTVTEAILRKWARSNDPRLQQAFVEVAYGKTPIVSQVSGKDGGSLEILIKYADSDLDLT